MSKSGTSISFKYNDNGIRTEKKIGSVTTKYFLDGDKVILEDNGTDKIHYTYDAGGIMDSNGTQVVSYIYDTWGKLISIDGTLKDSVGIKNPYRYRGYRYDTETGLYYLQSRYYNPEWGRFINADGIVGVAGQLLSQNMFMYCSNNPVMMKDPSGFLHRLAAEDGCGYTNTSLGSTVITSAITAGATSSTDNYISNTVLKPFSINQVNIKLRNAGVNRASRRALIRNIPNEMRDIELPAKGIAKFQSSVGVLTAALYGLVVVEDWQNNSNTRNRAISIGIDTIGLGAGIIAGSIIGSLGAPVLVGAGLVLVTGYAIGKGTGWLKGKFQVN